MLQNSIPFKRGSTFTFLLELPPAIEDGHFVNWTLKSQIRRMENATPDGFIANLAATWEDPVATTRVIKVHATDTQDWPLGIAEVDIVFTSPVGVKVSSGTLYFDIQRSVTE